MVFVLLGFVTIISYMMYTQPISGISDYVYKNTGCNVIKTEQTDTSIYCLYSKDDSSECGIVSFDKKPFQRCIRRTLVPVGQEKYATDFFQIGKNDKIFASFACGGLNPNKFKTCIITINGTLYTRNIAKEPFIIVIELTTSPELPNTRPIIEFSN